MATAWKLLEAFAQGLGSLNYSALAIPTDRAPQQVKNLVQQPLAEYGSINVLINNTGIYASGSVDSF